MGRSHNSLSDVDWDGPQDPDRFYMPQEMISLYGMALWQKMPHRKRVELSRQGPANPPTRAVWSRTPSDLRGTVRVRLARGRSGRPGAQSRRRRRRSVVPAKVGVGVVVDTVEPA
ncbi:diiron oxygenase [Nocardia cyriacigeorgica]|uniref:diiron oxygenase n=1 Tax=Nocardia cyriacigeorgica TaxID=135487 RepID=UPI003D7A5078